MIPSAPITLSGSRFRVTYRVSDGVAADATEAVARAEEIAVEQTVEFPFALLPAGPLRDQIVGQVEGLDPTSGGWLATISYAVETAGADLTQLFNVVFGNSSMKPGIRVERLDLPEALLAAHAGPRFGKDGFRAALGVTGRALLATALKPMGLPVVVLADLTYRLALGGIDIVKDDHGLTDQAFSPFAERVRRCVEAVERANGETGRRAVYAPNVTADGGETARRARIARGAGAGAVLISPGLAGFGQMSRLAADPEVGLPILSHPAFQGSYVVSPNSGIAHAVLFGQIARLAGSDGTIYPNYGGRFSFSPPECRSIARAAAEPMGSVKPIFPVPGGGMTVDRVPELLDFYGDDVILLVGGGLFQHGPDLVANCQAFRRMVEQRS